MGDHSIHVKCLRCGRRFWVARFLANGQDRSEALCVPCGTRSPIWLAEIKPKSADHAKGEEEFKPHFSRSITGRPRRTAK